MSRARNLALLDCSPVAAGRFTCRHSAWGAPRRGGAAWARGPRLLPAKGACVWSCSWAEESQESRERVPSPGTHAGFPLGRQALDFLFTFGFLIRKTF